MSPVQGTLETSLNLLADVVAEGDSFRAECPVHHGHSLIIRYKADEDWVQYHCKAGCDQQELITALRKLGIRIGSPRKRYTYTDVDGEAVFAKVRTRGRDGRRITFWECYGKNGVPTVHNSAKRGTQGKGGLCKRCGKGRPAGLLYNLPAVNAAIADGDEIWLVEGEKDADALSGLGVTATSSMNGVADWGPAYSEALEGARAIVIVADNDPHGAGKKGAYNRYLSLTDHAGAVAIRIAADNLKDSADHIAAGHGLGDFVEVDPDDLAELVGLSNGGKHYTDPLPGEEMSEVGYDHRFVELRGAEVRHVPTWSRGLYWDGKRWRTDELNRIMFYVTELVREMTRVYQDIAERSEDDKDAKRLSAKALSFEGATHIRNIASLASANPKLACRPKDFDAHPFLLNCANGVYDLRTGELAPHDPALMLSRVTAGAFDREADGSVFKATLQRVQPDKYMREYLGRIYGACLEGRVTEQMLVIFHGTGANGKSTLNDAVSYALGSYATEVDPRVLRGGDRHPTEIASLAGRRLVLVEELAKRLNESTVKLLTSQTPLQARRMREDPWTFTPTHNIIASANAPPTVDGSDEGIWRRVRLVPWDVRIPDREQDSELGYQLREEADYILTWLLAGYSRYRKRGLTPPHRVREENVAFREISDPVHTWVALECEEGSGYRETSEALHAAFEEWRKGRKLDLVNRKRFGQALTGQGFKRGRAASGSLWKGLRLRPRT